MQDAQLTVIYMVLATKVKGNLRFREVEQQRLTPINISSSMVWSPITQKIKTFSADTISMKLGDTKDIPICTLLSTLEQKNMALDLSPIIGLRSKL